MTTGAQKRKLREEFGLRRTKDVMQVTVGKKEKPENAWDLKGGGKQGSHCPAGRGGSHGCPHGTKGA